jgi:hemin uptake protein HemP
MAKDNEIKVIENETFDHFRKRAKAITNAIELLREHNYIIIDHEGKWIKKDRIID